MKIKVVFFDAGETLLYRNPSLSTIAYRFLKKNKINIMKEEIEKFISDSANEMKKIVIKAKLSDSEKWDIFIRKFFKKIKVKDEIIIENVREKLKKGTSFRPFKEVFKVFDFLKKSRIKIGIISNAPVELKDILKRTGILKKIDYLIISEEVGYEKPNKKIFEYALKKAKITPGECIYVGDNYIADICGAKKAGIKPIWILRNTKNAHFSYKTQKKHGNVIKIKNLKKIIDFWAEIK